MCPVLVVLYHSVCFLPFRIYWTLFSILTLLLLSCKSYQATNEIRVTRVTSPWRGLDRGFFVGAVNFRTGPFDNFLGSLSIQTQYGKTALLATFMRTRIHLWREDGKWRLCQHSETIPAWTAGKRWAIWRLWDKLPEETKTPRVYLGLGANQELNAQARCKWGSWAHGVNKRWQDEGSNRG